MTTWYSTKTGEVVASGEAGAVIEGLVDQLAAMTMERNNLIHVSTKDSRFVFDRGLAIANNDIEYIYSLYATSDGIFWKTKFALDDALGIDGNKTSMVDEIEMVKNMRSELAAMTAAREKAEAVCNAILCDDPLYNGKLFFGIGAHAAFLAWKEAVKP